MTDDDLTFEWDPDKAETNLRRHRISFEAASFVFDDPFRLEEEDAFPRGEYRFLITGEVDAIIVTVVCAYPEEGVVRLISARRATPTERRIYEQNRLQT